MSRKHSWIEPASLEHLDRLNPIENVKKRVDIVRETMKASKDLHYFSIFSSDGKLLGVTGADVIEEGTWEFWSLPDHQVVDYFIGYSRAARDFMRLVCEQHGVIRAQAWIDTRFRWAETWAEFLGMKPEGDPVPLGDDGKTYRMYAKVSS